jgi:hypothetical protein
MRAAGRLVECRDALTEHLRGLRILARSPVEVLTADRVWQSFVRVEHLPICRMASPWADVSVLSSSAHARLGANADRMDEAASVPVRIPAPFRNSRRVSGIAGRGCVEPCPWSADGIAKLKFILSSLGGVRGEPLAFAVHRLPASAWLEVVADAEHPIL